MSPVAPPPASALPAGPAVRFVVQGDGVDADTSMVANALQMVRDESEAGKQNADVAKKGHKMAKDLGINISPKQAMDLAKAGSKLKK